MCELTNQSMKGAALKRQEHKQSVSNPHSCCLFKAGNSFALPLLHNQCLCEWKSRRRGTGVCRSDDVHSLTTKQILPSSNTREMSHTSTHKATVQDQTCQSVFSILYQDRNTKFTCGKVSVILSVHPVYPDCSSHFRPKNIVSPVKKSLTHVFCDRLWQLI